MVLFMFFFYLHGIGKKNKGNNISYNLNQDKFNMSPNLILTSRIKCGKKVSFILYIQILSNLQC